MKHIFLHRLLMSICCFSMLAVVPSAWAQNFTLGNLVISQAASATANNTTASFLEVNPSLTAQTTPVQSINISGTGANAIRISGSATSTGYLSRTNDGSLVTLTGVNTNNTTANVNTLNPRAVVAIDANKSVSIATSYTGSSGNQTRSATSMNNTNWFIADQNGLYTNNSTSPSPSGNFRGIKAFGGTVYVSQASNTTTLSQVSSISATSGGTIIGLPGLPNNVNLQDFYLIRSGSNGTTYDVLYIISATSNTAGTIAKFSLVSGSWVANGTYATTFGGFGLAAQSFGSGARLYVTTGQGALTGNSVIQLTDAVGYNSPLTITTASNAILFTTATGTTIKGIDFAPAAACPAITAALNGTSTICSGSSTNLTATLTGGTAPYSLTYSNGTSTSVVSGTTLTISPTISTTYTIVAVTDANGCAATVSGTAVVTVNPQPTVANAGISQTITAGNSATLAANVPTTGTGSWSVTSGPSTAASQFSSVTDPTATFTPSGGAGDYVLTWTISNAPCAPSSSSVAITVSLPSVNLSVSSSTASEATPTAITVTATASAPVVGDQTVSLAVTGAGVTAGDYTLSGSTITIPAGQTAGSITFTVVDDNAVEGTETAILTIGNPSAGIALGSVTSQSITLTDNDVAPGLSIDNVSQNEGNSGTTTFTFTVSLATPAPAGGVNFDIATQDGTATNPSDYTAKSYTGQTIPAGSSTYNFSVLVNGDTMAEPNETFSINVTNVTGATVSDGQGTGTIINDDQDPMADLSVTITGAPDPVTVGSSLTYTVTATNNGPNAAANSSVTLSTPPGTTFFSATTPAGWSATTPAVGGTGTITINNNSVSVGNSIFTIVVTPTVANAALQATVNVFTTTTDPNPNNGSSTTTTRVNPANQPPVAPTFTTQTGIVAVPFSYTVPAFTDPESQSLTYAITGLPAGLVADNVSLIISGTPTMSGSSTVTVVASDPQSASTAGTFTITINGNQAPTASSPTNQTATVGIAFSYAVPAFSDPENQSLTYAATGVPSPLTFDSSTRVISGTPSTTGVSTIIIIATDPASNTASATFSLTVNAAPVAPAGQIRVTEYMYSSNNGAGNGVGEFVELTNVGNAPIDLTGWSFDDNTRTPGSFTGISGFGVVQPNESVLITDATAAQFRTFWFLPTSVKIAGGNTENLGRSDEINIYDNTNTLVTRLTYNDQGTSPAGTVRTQFVSAWPQRNLLGQTNTGGWQLSVANDVQNSYLSTTGDLGNPGGYFIPLSRVKVYESGGTPGTTVVAEGGATDSYTVVLNNQPTSDVTVTITPGSQLTVNPATLTFTPTNFSTVQTVTVTAVDDAEYQGAPRSVTITQSASSSDVAYNGLTVNPVSVTIIDNDVATTAPPSISVAATSTAYLNPPNISGVIGNPTDPAATLGISFTLADADTPVANLTLTATANNQSVVPNANLVITGSSANRNLKITPAGVGYATITVTITDGTNPVNYVINYAASAASTTTSRFHTGRSDASTAQDAGNGYMFVGDDESNVLRLYNRTQSGLPVNTFDFESLLGLTDISGGVPREVDIEASARNGNRVYWFGSQSNSESGSSRPNRDRVFTTDLTGSGASATLAYVGRYDFLREDLIAWDVNNGHGKGANYYGFAASAASGVNSKMDSGYNIEGAEFAPDNSTLYIGFRAPQVPLPGRTKALIVPVKNLVTLAVNGGTSGSATFDAPIELDLGGRGIREIKKNAANQYLIVAGAAGSFGGAPNDFRLYTWTGNPVDAPVLRTGDLSALGSDASSIESIVEIPVTLDENSSIQFLLDNGDMVYYNDGTIAKDLTQNNFKKSRSDYATVGAPFNTAPIVANAVSPQSATIGTAYTLSLANTFTDTETPNNLTLTVAGLPASLSYSNGIISGTPSTTVGSPFLVTVTATDPGSLTASTTFTLTVQPAPVVVTSLSLVASANPTTILTTGTTTLSATVSGGTTPYSYTFSGPGTITPSGNTATVSGLTAGVQTFTITASDATAPTSQTIATTVSVTVNAANQAPVATANANQTATVGTAFSYTVNAFTDETPASLVYTASGLPTGLSFDAGNRVISGTPSMTGVSTVSITATDPGSLSASTTFTITVSASAVTPTGPATLTITSFNCFSTNGALSSVNFVVGYSNGTFTPALPDLFINGVTITGKLGQPYTFNFDGNQSFLPIQDQATRTTYFVWDFRSACAGPVTPPSPTAPVAPSLPNQTATQGTPFSYVVPAFTGTAPIAYAASGLPAGLSFDASSRTISGTPSLTGVSTVVVSASNAAGQSSGQFTITVSASATQPTGPATLTITSFNCFSTNSALSSVNFVVGYSNGTFSPAVPNLFINGVTITGQLGQTYSFPLDANTGPLPIQDNATRSTYFVWDFRSACAGPVTPPSPTAPVAPSLPNQTATQGTPFSYVVPAFTGTAPIAYAASGLPAGLSFDASSRTISGTPSLTGVSTVVVSASNVAGQSSGQFTITVSGSATQPTGPATLTITSFNCFSTNGALSSVNFVVGYSNGTFSPALPNLFINGVTITGQLGQTYSFPLDANTGPLPIQDNATRSTYFVWDYRSACATQPLPTRLAAEGSAPLQLTVLGNPVNELLEVAITGAAGGTLQVSITDAQGRTVGQHNLERAGTSEVVRFTLSQQATGILLLRATTPTQQQTIRVLKAN